MSEHILPQQQEKSLPDKAITVSPFYYSAVNEITEPDNFRACSRYVSRVWKRELGPNGFAILTSLRDRCFLNRKTDERREDIQIKVEEIAEECGISDKTVRRELQNNRALRRFVLPQREFEIDPRRGGLRFGPSTYHVAMDDPIHPSDEARLIEIMRRKAEEAEKQPEDPRERARRRATSGQNDRTEHEPSQRPVKMTERKDKMTGRRDNLSPTSGQNDRTLKNHDSLSPENTSITPAAPGDSLSLFPEKKAAAPQVKEPFPEDLRPLWEEKARQLFVSNGVSAPGARAVSRHAEAMWRIEQERRNNAG